MPFSDCMPLRVHSDNFARFTSTVSVHRNPYSAGRFAQLYSGVLITTFLGRVAGSIPDGVIGIFH